MLIHSDEAVDLKDQARAASDANDLNNTLKILNLIFTSSSEIEFAIELANGMERKSHLPAASSIMRAALEHEPNDAVLLVETAKLEYRLHNYDEMARLGEIAVSLQPTSIPVICGFAELLRQTGRLHRSVSLLAQAINRQGPDPEFIAHLAHALKATRGHGLESLSSDDIVQALGHASDNPDVRALLNEFYGSHDTFSTGDIGARNHDGPSGNTIIPEDLSQRKRRFDELEDHEIHLVIEEKASEEGIRHVIATARQEDSKRAIILAFFHLISRGHASENDFLQLFELSAHGSSEVFDWSTPARLQLLDLGIAFHPGASILWAERAKIWLDLNDHRQAQADAAWAFSLDVHNISIISLYADILWHAGDRVFALRFITQERLKHQTNDILTFKNGQFAFWTGDLPTALELLVKIGSSSALIEETHYLVAAILHASGDDVAAEERLMPLLSEGRNVRAVSAYAPVALALIWPTIPHYIDMFRVDRLQALLQSIETDKIAADLLWDCVSMFIHLRRDDFALSLMDKATEAVRHVEFFPHSFLKFLAYLMDVQDYTTLQGQDRRALGSSLNQKGIIHSATGNSFFAAILFKLSGFLWPTNSTIAFNAGFSALASGDLTAAEKHFRKIDRVYKDEMKGVIWPRRKQAIWPYKSFNLFEMFVDRYTALKTWPRITVITPSFQQGEFIEETILSIVNQDYPNLEYIIVDGQSSDDTHAIIDRYRRLVDHIIIEKDNGQTEAINKGLALATGELITWINSDDMLAPGALFAIAANYMMSRADILFGICLPHVEYSFELANLPAVRQETFTPNYLTDIFGYWMKGFFFYQPEVVFTRRILDKAGGKLDESLYFTMDYDFWMKCCLAGAKVEPVHWPIALFRQHANQKTANLLDCIIEQSELRNRSFSVRPSLSRLANVRDGIEAAFRRAKPRVGVVTSRLGKIFSPDSAADLMRSFREHHVEVQLVRSVFDLGGDVDILIMLIHLQDDVNEINSFRQRSPSVPIVGWFWDNHHHLFENYDVAKLVDVVIPGHSFAASYLCNWQAIQIKGAPLCVTQWSHGEAKQLFNQYGRGARNDVLYGGFVRYSFAEKRNRLIEDLIKVGEEGVYFLDEKHLSSYFGKSQRLRFEEWAGHKTSICLPLRGDLSQRLFDSLLTGQVPIIAGDVRDLHLVMSEDEWSKLPVVMLKSYSVEDVRAAHQEAIRRFDEGGIAGAVARHRFALERHTFPARIADMIRQLREEVMG